MSAILSEFEYTLFKKYLEEKTGIEIGREKVYLIETRLERLLAEFNLSSFQQLYYAALSDSSNIISEKIINAITTNETLWFRDKIPWRYIEQNMLPKFIEKLRRREKSKIRIWSAAAASGQEAYSTAMMIDNYIHVNRITDVSLSQFEIVATDISQTVLDAAKSGKYDSISIMRGLDDYYRNKYFTKNGSAYELDEKVRNIVLFKKFNLKSSFISLGSFDIIFLRYVMIYFGDALRADISKKLLSSLNSDGVLFLGSSELYKCISVNFKTQYYERGMLYTKS